MLPVTTASTPLLKAPDDSKKAQQKGKILPVHILPENSSLKTRKNQHCKVTNIGFDALKIIFQFLGATHEKEAHLVCTDFLKASHLGISLHAFDPSQTPFLHKLQSVQKRVFELTLPLKTSFQLRHSCEGRFSSHTQKYEFADYFIPENTREFTDFKEKYKGLPASTILPLLEKKCIDHRSAVLVED